MTNTDFTDPFAYQQALAQSSLQRAQQEQQYQPQKGQMVGRVYVPTSPVEHLAGALRNIIGGQQERQAIEEMKGIGAQRQEAQNRDMSAFVDILRGKPAQPAFEAAGPAPQGAPQEGGYTVPAQAAKAGDPYAAYSQAMTSQSPMMRKIGAEGTANLAEAMQKQQAAQQQSAQYQKIWQASGNDPMKAISLGLPVEAAKKFSELNGNPLSDLLIRDANGNLVPNTPLVEARKSIQKAGAANVNVNTANKPMLTELGKGVGEGITNAWMGAQSAAGTLQNVAQMRQGLNNAFIGPAANQRVSLAQIGEVLGVNGANTTEKLENTRNVMQGLARQELSAAGQMKGQGQITESERGILRKAESGQINELTKPELNVLLGALEKTANARISQHNQNLQRLKRDPAAAGVADYMNVEIPSIVTKPNAPNADGASRIRFDAQGNIIP